MWQYWQKKTAKKMLESGKISHKIFSKMAKKTGKKLNNSEWDLCSKNISQCQIGASNSLSSVKMSRCYALLKSTYLWTNQISVKCEFHDLQTRSNETISTWDYTIHEITHIVSVNILSVQIGINKFNILI